MPDRNDERRRELLAIELVDFDLEPDDLDAAAEFAEQVETMALIVGAEADGPVSLAISEVTQALATSAIDEEIEEDSAAGYGPACKAGCSACCHIPVSATTADVASLLEWLGNQPEDLLVDVVGRTYEALPRASGAEPRGVLPCPLLDLEEGICRAYEARPLACRGCFSDDASQCVPGGTISTFLVPQVIARSAAVGARLALADAGEDDRCDDLIVALARAFDDVTE